MPEFVERFYVMNPETEDVITKGLELKNGMVVLRENGSLRANLAELDLDWMRDRALTRNRWCTVTNVHYVQDLKVVQFTGIYEDGTRRVRNSKLTDSWLVKKSSVDFAKEKYAVVHDMLLAIIQAQDEATMHGDGSGEIVLMVEQAARKIAKIYGMGI